MPAEDELSGLIDIYVPDELEIGIFPPAVGWWVVLVTIIVSYTVYKIIARYRFNSIKGYCQRQMLYLESDYNTYHNLKAYAEGVSVLLKIYAIMKYGNEQVANLYGAQWKAFLKEHSDGKTDDNILDIIVNAAYFPDTYEMNIDTKAVNEFVKGFVRR